MRVLGSLLASSLATLLALASRPLPAAAEDTPGRVVSFGIGGGVSVPMGDAKDAYKTGFNGQAYVRLDLGAIPLALRGDFTYQSFDVHLAHFANVIGATGGTGTLLAGVASTQVYLLRGNLRPYVLAGLGAYTLKTELDGTTVPSASETHFGIDGGVGLLATIGLLSLYAEGHVDNVYTDRHLTQSNAFQIVPVTLGIVF